MAKKRGMRRQRQEKPHNLELRALHSRLTLEDAATETIELQWNANLNPSFVISLIIT
jgi:hypothetical protein